MPTFIADCVSARGADVRRVQEAANAAAARAALRDAGFFPVVIRESTSRYRRTKVARRHLIALFHELSLLLESQTLLQALDGLRSTYPNRALRAILSDIHDALASSRASAPDAFGAFPRTFTPEIVSLIAAGEAAGSAGLSARFADLEEQLIFEAENRSGLLAAISYPLGLAVAVASLVAFVFVFLAPKLQDLVSSFNTTLPPVTLAIFAIAEFVQHHSIPLILLGALPVVTIPLLWRYEPTRLILDTLALRLPLLGEILRFHLIATVAKTYASLYSAGRQAPEICLSCSTAVSNRRARRVLIQMHHRVALEGFSPEDAFAESAFWPPMIVMSIRNGAATGSLGKQLRFVAAAAADAARRRSAALAVVLRYVALFCMGGIVGLVVYGLIAPLFSLGLAIK